MAHRHRVSSRRFTRLLVATAVGAAWLGCPGAETTAQETTAIQPVDELEVSYARVCLRLAEADLAQARTQNLAAEHSVAAYDIERLEMHAELARQRLALAERGFDFGELIKLHIEMQARLAEHDLESARQLRETTGDRVTDLQLEQLASYAELCRLRVSLSQSQSGRLDLIEHLHWETHRLNEEVLLLNRRVERLEETALR